MTQLVKVNGDMPSLISDFFEDDPLLNFNASKFMMPRFGYEFFSKIPAANIMETDKNFSIELGAPGMEKKDFHVEVENGNLCISSEKKEEKKESKKGFTKREFSYNSFSRSFRLPENTMPDKIKAKYENGILKIDIPKKAGSKKTSKKEVKVI